MPSWSRKDERQFKHVRDSVRERGVEAERAEEIAARTVNKQRRHEGRTPSKRTQGTGNPHKPLAQRTAGELRNLAARMHIAGRSRMRKAELVQAIEVARG